MFESILSFVQKLDTHGRSQVNRNICALDMEASAFLMLCNFLHVGCLGVVKGVSDFGDAHKGEEEDVYEEALKETALAVQKWAIQHLRTVQWRVSEGEVPKPPARHYTSDFEQTPRLEPT